MRGAEPGRWSPALVRELEIWLQGRQEVNRFNAHQSVLWLLLSFCSLSSAPFRSSGLIEMKRGRNSWTGRCSSAQPLLCRESASNPSIRDISASLLRPIKSCDTRLKHPLPRLLLRRCHGFPPGREKRPKHQSGPEKITIGQWFRRKDQVLAGSQLAKRRLPPFVSAKTPPPN